MNFSVTEGFAVPPGEIVEREGDVYVHVLPLSTPVTAPDGIFTTTFEHEMPVLVAVNSSEYEMGLPALFVTTQSVETPTPMEYVVPNDPASVKPPLAVMFDVILFEKYRNAP